MSPRAFCLAALLASSLTLAACGSGSSNAPQEGSLYASCTDIDASATCSTDGASFEATVQPILAKSCLPACHDGSPDAAWPLTDYDDVQAWTTFVSADLLQCAMPPVANAGQYPITRHDRETILQWIVCGTPP